MSTDLPKYNLTSEGSLSLWRTNSLKLERLPCLLSLFAEQKVGAGEGARKEANAFGAGVLFSVSSSNYPLLIANSQPQNRSKDLDLLEQPKTFPLASLGSLTEDNFKPFGEEKYLFCLQENVAGVDALNPSCVFIWLCLCGVWRSSSVCSWSARDFRDWSGRSSVRGDNRPRKPWPLAFQTHHSSPPGCRGFILRSPGRGCAAGFSRKWLEGGGRGSRGPRRAQ